jgi:large subunit ribosomal protein L34e
MVARLQFRRHVSWNTRSNTNRRVKTPGGRLTFLVAKKKSKPSLCADTKKKLQGVKIARPFDQKHLKRRQRKVYRTYGGALTSMAVKKRIIRAFLIEEQRCVKAVLQAKEAEQRREEQVVAKKAAKKDKKKKTG